MTVNEIRSFLFNNWKRYFQAKPEPSDLVFSLIKGRYKSVFHLFILYSSEPKLVIKISENADNEYRLIREYESLLRLHKDWDLDVKVPFPFDLVTLNGKKILIESALVGTPMVLRVFPPESRSYKNAIERNFDLALNWLLCLHKKTSSRGAFNNNNMENLRFHWLTHIEHLADFSYFHGIGSKDEFFKIIKNSDFPTIFSHGDFNPDNILLEKEILKVFDWEWSYYPGLPLLDLLNFSLYYHITTTIIGKARSRSPIYEDFIHVFSKSTFLGEVAMRYYHKYCEELTISPDIRRIMFSLFLLRHLSKIEITKILNERNLYTI